MLNVVQLTTGGIIIPPQRDFSPSMQVVPFYFVEDLFSMYRTNGLDWFFWNSLRLTFFNFIMLMPLGIYLSLFKLKGRFKAFLVVFLVSLSIEIMQLTFAHMGLVRGRGLSINPITLPNVFTIRSSTI
ncbi:VanZ family protein [Radiobacillus sp. PE A8.2]|uniref:VanZ family protein n=1 Tax=Radiobacillus sp. PE A8.2 TaxID=3380349 RepID=UPI00388EBA32